MHKYFIKIFLTLLKLYVCTLRGTTLLIYGPVRLSYDWQLFRNVADKSVNEA